MTDPRTLITTVAVIEGLEKRSLFFPVGSVSPLYTVHPCSQQRFNIFKPYISLYTSVANTISEPSPVSRYLLTACGFLSPQIWQTFSPFRETGWQHVGPYVLNETMLGQNHTPYSYPLKRHGTDTEPNTLAAIKIC